MTPDTYQWGSVIPMADGHRLFPLLKQRLESGDVVRDPYKHVAIADNSGREPQDTDDGVLWLDHKRPLMISNDGTDHFSIPLRNEQGHESRTPTNASTLLYLASTYNWPLVDTFENEVYDVKSR